MDDSKEPESKAGEPKPPKTKAEDNPWYLLATLYGVPAERDDEPRTKNRVAWNRYFAATLDSETRARLIDEKRHTEEELTPFSPAELQEIEKRFTERKGSTKKTFALPGSRSEIDFSNVQFVQDVGLAGYLFVGNVDFEAALFLANADFGGVTFFGVAKFDGATFVGVAKFENTGFVGMTSFFGTTFASPAIFLGATFYGTTLFAYATFSSMAHFVGVTFSRGNPYGHTSFARAKFYGDANFLFANFGGNAGFEKTEFFRTVGFLKATFARSTTFDRGTFFDDVNFDTTFFSEETVFADASFEKSTRFVNAEMKGETSFERATFKMAPPKFFGAKLHQGTVWRDITWPTVPNSKDEAGRFIDAYACIKLEMDRLKKHEDELDFFALELQSRRVQLGPWRGLPFALYGLLSNYGRSYLRPFSGLFVTALLSALAFWLSGSFCFLKSLGLGFANTLNVFGFRKDFFPDSLNSLHWGLDFLAAVQTTFGTILLFLFGLGIRNRFRMK